MNFKSYKYILLTRPPCRAKSDDTIPKNNRHLSYNNNETYYCYSGVGGTSYENCDNHDNDSYMNEIIYHIVEATRMLTTEVKTLSKDERVKHSVFSSE